VVGKDETRAASVGERVGVSVQPRVDRLNDTNRRHIDGDFLTARVAKEGGFAPGEVRIRKKKIKHPQNKKIEDRCTRQGVQKQTGI